MEMVSDKGPVNNNSCDGMIRAPKRGRDANENGQSGFLDVSYQDTSVGR